MSAPKKPWTAQGARSAADQAVLDSARETAGLLRACPATFTNNDVRDALVDLVAAITSFVRDPEWVTHAARNSQPERFPGEVFVYSTLDDAMTRAAEEWPPSTRSEDVQAALDHVQRLRAMPTTEEELQQAVERLLVVVAKLSLDTLADDAPALPGDATTVAGLLPSGGASAE